MVGRQIETFKGATWCRLFLKESVRKRRCVAKCQLRAPAFCNNIHSEDMELYIPTKALQTYSIYFEHAVN